MSLFARRRHDEWLEAIRPELQALPELDASTALWERINTSRARGTRVILPVADRDGGTSIRRPIAVTMLVAAAVGLAVLLPLRAPRVDAELPMSEWGALNVVHAQPGGAAAVPPLRLVHPNRLQPRSLTYRTTWQDRDGRETGRTLKRIDMQARDLDGVAAWHLTSVETGVRSGLAVRLVDTAVVARADLRPLYRFTLESPYLRYEDIRIRQRFTGLRMVGRMIASGADASSQGRPIDRTLPPDASPYVFDPFAPLILGAAELAPGFVRRVSMIGWGVVDHDVSTPVQLHVTGRETIRVRAEAVDCWRITIPVGGRTLDYWVRVSDGVGVRLRSTSPDGSMREMILESP